MTPGARVAAAIEVLDRIVAGEAAEQALTRWARRSRFAGSKDRAAMRDHVFDTIRCQRSAALLGGGMSGRALMIGLMRARGEDLGAVFSGEGHAPTPLDASEKSFRPPPLDRNDRWNLPDWVAARLEDSLREEAENAALLLQSRAPVTLRVNRRRATRSEAQSALAVEGIETEPLSLAPHALRVISGAQRLRNSRGFREGVIELQDGHSQAVVADLPSAHRVLDFCAGGGGKALAIADQTDAAVVAHDIDPGRMKDIPQRAARAGVTIHQRSRAELASEAPFDLVLCDAPCSGSGSWRRAPEAKWRLTQDRLRALIDTQDRVLREAADLVAPGGTLVYVTCSVFTDENCARVDAFLAEHPRWRSPWRRAYPITPEADGFYAAHFIR